MAVIRWFNDCGDINVGDKKYKLELKYYDDESSSDKIHELMSKLVEEDHVNFIILPYSSLLGKAVAPVVNAHKVIMEHIDSPAILYKAGYKYVVEVLSPASSYLKSVVVLLKAQNDPNTKVALIYENAPFAGMIAEGTKEKLQEYGFSYCI